MRAQWNVRRWLRCRSPATPRTKILGLFLALTVLFPFVTFHGLPRLPIHEKFIPVSTAADSKVCLTHDCIHGTAARLARAYPDKTNTSAWIITDSSPNHPRAYSSSSSNFTSAGIIYVKNFKAASSTAAGIALRIAYRRYSADTTPEPNHENDLELRQQLQHLQEHAWVKFSHVRGFKYAKRDPQHSVLFTSLRDPAARAMSRIFYTSITQKGESPTDENILQKLRWNHRQYGAVSHEGGGYQVRYCSMHQTLNTSWSLDKQRGGGPHTVVNPRQVERNVQEIIHAYDFIMVAERMDESVVALALLLGLELGDVLVMDAKQNSNGGNGGGKSGGGGGGQNKRDYLYFSYHDRKTQRMIESCRLSVPAFRSPAVQAHLESTEWYAKNYGDYLLHSAAMQSLDLTIARLGRERFDVALTEYRHLKAKARQRCTNETIWHCSGEGKVQRNLSAKNCYSDDSGCGYACIDRMLLAENNERHFEKLITKNT